MRWFDDVWTKEVFANFMADKISRQQFPDVNHDLAFIKTHYPLALNTDRTEGTHPIQQPLDNLNQAGLLYGNIIYHKAPIMMRKLEQEKGYIDLREGLRSYLLKYAYGNATWDDLIAELDKYAPEHSARSFSDVWVKQKGLPTVTCEREENGSLLISQQDPYSRGLAWKQAFEVGYLVDGRLTGSDDVYMYDRTVAIDVPEDAVPILNFGGDGYGRFAMSEQALSVLSRVAVFLSDEKCRYAAVMNLYENYHLGNIGAEDLLETLLTILGQETNELIASTVCSDIAALCSRIEDSQRPALEQRLLEMAQSHGLQSVRQTLLRHLGTTAVSPMVVEWLYDIWQNQGSPLLNQRDYTRMAYHLALMRPDTWQQILDTQRTRLKTDDERNEFDFVSRACDPDEAVQQQLFEELLKVENRRVEPWARTMLALLNDPTREPFSNRYLESGLDALEEIQRTGDIFFPGYWLSSLMGGHRSNEAREIVQTWINGHTSLKPALMNKVNENAYWLLKR
jgi:aminopeptidase N